MKNHHISEAGVSFENKVWSVYQDMGWRAHFLHMAASYRLKRKMLVEVVCFAFKLSEAMPYLQPGGTPVRGTNQ